MAVFEVLSVTEDDVLGAHESTELTTGIFSHAIIGGDETVFQMGTSVMGVLRAGVSVL